MSATTAVLIDEHDMISAPAGPRCIRSKRVLRQHRQHRLRDRGLFSDPRKIGLIALRCTTATDDADGADGVFSIRAHPDDPRPCAAFPGKRDLDAQRPEEGLRPPQSTGKGPRIFCPWCRDVNASMLRTQPHEVGCASRPDAPMDHK